MKNPTNIPHQTTQKISKLQGALFQKDTNLNQKETNSATPDLSRVATSLFNPSSLPPKVYKELYLSAVPKDIIEANIDWIKGEAAVQLLSETAIAALGGHSLQYVTRSAQRILERYDFARAGGWVTYGQTLDGDQGSVAYFKARCPRPKPHSSSAGFGNDRRGRSVKYESPQGQPGLPILAKISFNRGLTIAMKNGKGVEYVQHLYQIYNGIYGSLNPEASNCLSQQEATLLNACQLGQWQYASRHLHSLWKLKEQGHRLRIGDKLGLLEHLGGEVDKGFWRWAQAHGIAVAITEGCKKAWSLIAQGVLTIAIRGITMWHKKGSQLLHDTLAAFATPGRSLYIAFDQDDKPKTVKAVRKQALALGQALEKTGANVRVLQWDNRLGKGVDDALFTLEVERAINQSVYHRPTTNGLQTLLNTALTLKQFARRALMAQAFDTLDRLETLSYPLERQTHGANTPGGYMPPLPPLTPKTIHVVNCGLGGGKTYRIGQDWVPIAKANGQFLIVLSPMNALGQQTGQRWGLPHIHDAHPKDAHLLWTLARHEGGIVLWVDSLHRLPSWVWQQDVVLVMDEANQVIQGLSSAGTLGDRQSEILKVFTHLCEHAAATGSIVLSEDGIANRAVRFINALSQANGIRVFQHQRTQAPWDCTLYNGNK